MSISKEAVVDGASVRRHITIEADVVIVGTGAGGAVCGQRLAQQGWKVVFIEEGAHYPKESHWDLAIGSIARLYRQQGMSLAFGVPGFPVLQGSCVGGTTVINGGTCFRAPESVHQEWHEELGLQELSLEKMTPFYEALEKELHIAPCDFSLMAKSNLLVHEMLSKEGMQGRPLSRNAKDCTGCGMCCYGCTSGAKQSMDVSMIPKAITLGAKVFARAQASRIIRNGNSVNGVRARFLNMSGRPTGHFLEVHAPVTILAAGTIATPALLQRNGIRPSRHLGRNLTLHPAAKVYAEMEDQVMGWKGTPQAYEITALAKEGILFEGVFVPPDVGCSMTPFSGRKMHEFMSAYSRMATFGFMIKDSGTGSVRHIPGFGPLIWYRLRDEDVRRIVRGTAFLSRLFLRNGARRVVTLIRGAEELRGEADIERLEKLPVQPRDVEVAAFHPLGTARMGRTTAEGVVDESNRVFGCTGLYVCDGSVIPTALGVNPQLTIMAFAARLASILG